MQGNPRSARPRWGCGLLEGVNRGERVLYVSLSETRSELRGVAASHGWDVEKIPIFDLGDSALCPVLGSVRYC